MQSLVPQVQSMLQLLRIERPPLGAANAASIRQCRWGACTEAGQPLVGATRADPRASSESRQGKALIEVLVDQTQAAQRRQAGIGVAMHGGVRSGLVGRTSTRSGLTPRWPLINLLRQNI